jgi:hypothetical protein
MGKVEEKSGCVFRRSSVNATLIDFTFGQWIPDLANPSPWVMANGTTLIMVHSAGTGGGAIPFLSFPYVCPEPVLIKCSFLYINGSKRRNRHMQSILISVYCELHNN